MLLPLVTGATATSIVIYFSFYFSDEFDFHNCNRNYHIQSLLRIELHMKNFRSGLIMVG